MFTASVDFDDPALIEVTHDIDAWTGLMRSVKVIDRGRLRSTGGQKRSPVSKLVTIQVSFKKLSYLSVFEV